MRRDEPESSGINENGGGLPALNRAAAWQAFARLLCVERNPHRLHEAVCRQMVEDFGFSRAIIATLDPAGKQLVARAGLDPSATTLVSQALVKLFRIPLEPRPDGRVATAAWCVLNNEQVYVPDAANYSFRLDETMQQTLLARALAAEEYLLTPIRGNGRAIGVLGVDKKGQERRISSEERALVQVVGSMLGGVLTQQVETTAEPPRPRRSLAVPASPTRPEQPGRLQLVLEAMPIGLLLLGQQGEIVFVNRAAAAVLGVFRLDVIGKRWEQVMHVEELDSFRRFLDETRAGAPPRTGRWQLRASSTGAVEVEATVLHLAEAEADPVKAVLLEDVSEQVQLDRTREDFIAMLVHDLKAPAQSAAGFAELLLLERIGEMNETQKDLVLRIERSAQRQMKLIDDILEVEELEPGRNLLDKTRVEVYPLVQDVLDGLQVKASNVPVRLANDLAPDLPALYGDPLRLIEVFQNLIDNALNASKPGGMVRVSAQRRAVDGEEYLCFAIEDRGVGLAEEEAARLFAELGSGRKSARNGRRGGLGLVIARLIVEGHRGEIWAESAPGSGTTIRMMLPVHRFSP